MALLAPILQASSYMSIIRSMQANHKKSESTIMVTTYAGNTPDYYGSLAHSYEAELDQLQ